MDFSTKLLTPDACYKFHLVPSQGNFFSPCLSSLIFLDQKLRLWQALLFSQKVNSVLGQDINSNLFSLFGFEVYRFQRKSAIGKLKTS